MAAPQGAARLHAEDQGPRALREETNYPDTGPLAVAARLAFLLSVTAIALAVIAPGWLVPQLLYSHNLEHFAAFYVATLTALAAMPRTDIRRIGAGFVCFALGLQTFQLGWSLHLGHEPRLDRILENWVADTGGVAAALAPVVVGRFRRWFPPRK